MATATQSFSPQILNNCYGLESYIRDEPTLAKLEALSKDPKFVKTPSHNAPYFNRWQVIWITIKYPFETILSVLFTCVSFALNCLYLQKMSRVFSVLSKHMLRDWEQLTDQWDSQIPMIVPAFNTHQWTSWDLYQHGSIPLSFVQDEVVQHLSFHSAELKKGVNKAMKTFYKQLEKSRAQQGWFKWILRRGSTISKREKDQTTQAVTKLYRENPSSALDYLSQKYSSDALERPLAHFYEKLKITDLIVDSQKLLSLYSEPGVCRGASIWFIYLYLKTLVHFDDPEKHLIAVAELFKTGIPGPAALVHALTNTEELLQIKKQKIKNYRIPLHQLDCNHDNAKQKINSIPAGIYRVGVYKHSFVYVKINETQGFIWNPSNGLFKMTGEEMFQMILKQHYKPSDLHSHIYFEQYKNLENIKPKVGS